MNKEKLSKIKNKIKKNAPLIIAATAATAASVCTVIYVKNLLNEASTNDGFQLEVIQGETRQSLMSDPNFSLLKLTDDEYMFARTVTEE